jgi:hypothetical protein
MVIVSIATNVVSCIRCIYNVPFFSPLILPVTTKFLVLFFSEQETRSNKVKMATSDLCINLNFDNNTKKNPQMVGPIEDLNLQSVD